MKTLPRPVPPVDAAEPDSLRELSDGWHLPEASPFPSAAEVRAAAYARDYAEAMAFGNDSDEAGNPPTW